MDDEASAKIFPTAPKNMKKQASCLGSKETVDEKGGGGGRVEEKQGGATVGETH